MDSDYDYNMHHWMLAGAGIPRFLPPDGDHRGQPKGSHARPLIRRVRIRSLLCKRGLMRGLTDDVYVRAMLAKKQQDSTLEGLLRSGTMRAGKTVTTAVLIDTARNAIVGAGDFLPLGRNP